MLSIGLGIGANTAIFSLIDAVMLKALPVQHPEELVQVTMDSPQFFSNLLWEQIRDRQDVFRGIFAYGRWAFNLAPGGETRPVNGYFVAGGFFDTLGVRAAAGRTLHASDDHRGCRGAAVLSYGFWQSEYAGRTDIIGRTISINGHATEIVGVTEPRFTGFDVGSHVEVMTPMCAERVIQGESSILDVHARGSLFAWLRIVGRLKPGVTSEAATARLRMIAPGIFRDTTPAHWNTEDKAEYRKRLLITEPVWNGFSYVRQVYRQPLLILMGMVGLVLLIACANVANLLLARGAAQRREMAIRIALGCGRGRLMLCVLRESMLLAAAGAAFGVLLARWGTKALASYLDVVLDLTPDYRVLGFTIAITTATGILFGIVPAWRGSRIDPYEVMKPGERGSTGSRSLFGKSLVAAQVAICMLLVTGAGLMMTTFWRLMTVDPGFDRARVLTAAIDLRNAKVPVERRGELYRELLRRLRGAPGVRSASASVDTPMCGCRWWGEAEIEGYRASSREDATLSFNLVSGHYFDTLGIPFAAGRDFGDRDTTTSPAVAIVNWAMAQKYFGSENPLGRHFRILTGAYKGPVEIVGMVNDSKGGSLREQIYPTAYLAWTQDREPDPQANLELSVAAGDPRSIEAAVKQVLAQVEQRAAIEFTPIETKIGKLIGRERLLATLSGLFAGLAVLLAAIGLYGVLSYHVARRRSEIGIRIALGAKPADVLRMVMTETSLLAAIGLTVGLAASLASTRLVAGYLYGMKPNDSWTFAAAAMLLAGVAAGAAFGPARRASHVDPMMALRDE